MKCLDMATLKTLEVLRRKYSFSSMYRHLMEAMTVSLKHGGIAGEREYQMSLTHRGERTGNLTTWELIKNVTIVNLGESPDLLTH